MNTNHLNYQVALTLLEGVGSKTAKLLLAYLGNEESIFDKDIHLKTKIPGFAKERFRALSREKALQEAVPIIEFVQRNKIQTTFFTDSNYSLQLKECNDSPILLYHKGNFNFKARRSLAIVGTRNMTGYGKQIINELIETIAPYHVQVVSGLALGVDGYVHKKCLEHKVPTIGVLGHGLDRIYPSSHAKLARKMIETEGCGLITEFPNGTKPDKENFPQRNRIVAGMTHATIVIESGARGGSLITANLANEYNRDVFAYPGNVNQDFSIGCNHLIANNKAHLITNGKDLIKTMGWELNGNPKSKQIDMFEGLNGDEKTIVKTIKEFEKISLEVLSVRLKKPVNILSVLLLGLELRGFIMTLPGKKYILGKG